MRQINREKATRRIFITAAFREDFWRVVFTVATNNQAAAISSNPFVAAKLNQTIIDCIIAYGNATKSGDEEALNSLRVAASQMRTQKEWEMKASPSSESILLYINEQQREPFWEAMTFLGKRALASREKRNPFEVVNVSALLVGTLLEMSGQPVHPDDLIVSTIAMNKTLTMFLPQEARAEFWRKLLLLASRKNLLHSVRDRSDLLVDLVIALGNVEQTKDANALIASVGDFASSQQIDDAFAQRFDVETFTLVISVKKQVRTAFWEALTTLGNRELRRRQDISPFESISAGTLIIGVVLSMGNALENDEWGDLAAIVDIDPARFPSNRRVSS